MRHGIDLKPIHNVKDARAVSSHYSALDHSGPDLVFVTGDVLGAPYRAPSVAAKLRLVARFVALAGLVCAQINFANPSRKRRLGGAYRDRTDDLKLAKLALSQLS